MCKVDPPFADRWTTGWGWVMQVLVANVQRRPFKIYLGSADWWQNLDIFIWSWNRNAVSALAVSRTVPAPKTQETMQRLFLRKIGPCCHHSSWGQMDSHGKLVSASLSPDSLQSLIPVLPKNGIPWPFSSLWQCHCTHSSNKGWLSQ